MGHSNARADGFGGGWRSRREIPRCAWNDGIFCWSASIGDFGVTKGAGMPLRNSGQAASATKGKGAGPFLRQGKQKTRRHRSNPSGPNRKADPIRLQRMNALCAPTNGTLVRRQDTGKGLRPGRPELQAPASRARAHKLKPMLRLQNSVIIWEWADILPCAGGGGLANL